MEVIRVKSVSQIGDYFLMKFNCNLCDEPHFESNLDFKCGCGNNFKEIVLDVSKSERILVVGTMRKLRFGKKIIRKMYSEQDGKCAYCFKPLETDYHVEHILPLCVGGTNTQENICLSCPLCNTLAGSLVFDDFFQKQKYILEKLAKRNK